MNSTYIHCSQLTKSTIAGWEKKKERKKEENVEEKRLNPNSHYIYISEGDKNRRMRPDGPNGSMSMGQKKVEPIP